MYSRQCLQRHLIIRIAMFHCHCSASNMSAACRHKDQTAPAPEVPQTLPNQHQNDISNEIGHSTAGKQHLTNAVQPNQPQQHQTLPTVSSALRLSSRPATVLALTNNILPNLPSRGLGRQVAFLPKPGADATDTATAQKPSGLLLP